MAKTEKFLESVKDAINFAYQTAYLLKKLYKNNMIDNNFLLPDNNKGDSECVKFTRISGQEPRIFRNGPVYYSANILSVNRFVDFPYEKQRENIPQMFMVE